MAFPKNVYGVMDRFAPGIYEEERREFIAQVRHRQRERLQWFRTGLRKAIEGAETVPQTFEEGRAFVLAEQAAERIPRYPLKGDVWLQREFRRAGVEITGEVKRGPVRVRDKQDRVLLAWSSTCLRPGHPEDAAELEYFFENLFRWAQARDKMHEIESIGRKRLAAWLRAQGYKLVRRSSGTVVIALRYIKPV